MASPETRNTNFVGLNHLRFSPTARFVVDALEHKVHLNPPINPPKVLPGKSEEEILEIWNRRLDITLIYYLGEDEDSENNRSLSGKKVGEIFSGPNGPITRQAVSQILTKTVGDLWHNWRRFNPDIENQYPLETLLKQTAKQGFLTTPRGTMRKIIEDVDIGMDYAGLREKYSRDSLSKLRRILEPFGIQVPYEKSRQQTVLFIEKLKEAGPDTDRETLKVLLGQIDSEFVNDHRDIFGQNCIALSKLLRDLGFHFDQTAGELTVFTNKLDRLDIPFGHFINEIKNGRQKGEQKYYFLFKVQRKQIEEALLPDPTLAGFLQSKVSQICGVEAGKLPNTTQFGKRDYQTVGSLGKRLGMRIGGRGFDMASFLEGCPCPVYQYETAGGAGGGRHRCAFYYKATDESLLEDFLKKKTKI